MTIEIQALVRLNSPEEGGRIRPPQNPFRSQVEVDDNTVLSVSIEIDKIPFGKDLCFCTEYKANISFTTAPDEMIELINAHENFRIMEGSKVIGRGTRIFNYTAPTTPMAASPR